MNKAVFKQALLSSTIAITFYASPTLAQVSEPAEATVVPTSAAAAGDDAEIVVTSSRIQRPDLEVTSPVNVVGAEEIQYRQPATAEDLLRDLPSVRPAVGPGVNNGGNGSSTVDLRGIGANRTLVLLDGRRIVPYSLDGVTDLNTIPTALLERVDVVTGGASSVYGADAVAGVVNFITKRNFEGVSIGGNYRVTERGDTQQYRADILVGGNFADGRGNAVVGVGYIKRDPLFFFDREIGELPLSSVNGQFQGSQNTVPILFTAPTTTALGLGTGTLGAVLNTTTGALRLATQDDTYNSNDLSYYQTPLTRYSAFASSRFEVVPALELFSTAMFNRNHAVTSIAPSGTFQNTYQLPLSNAYLPAATRNQFCTAVGMTAAQCAAAATALPGTAAYREIPMLGQRRFVEFGPRVNDIESNQWQISIGARGDITDTLKYQLEGQYGETSTFNLYDNWGSNTRLQQAIRSYRDASGNPVCNVTTGGCVPINLFGPAGSITQPMINFIDLDAQVRRKVQLTNVMGNVGGDLFGLTSPFTEAPVAFSIGGEYRKLVAIAQPDANLQIQNEVLGTGAPVTPDRGEINVKEVYGELIAPIVRDRPFFHNLQLEAGIRYSDYNTTGTSTTWKAGGSWEPFEGYKARGMYQVAVRSPNIQELYSSQVQGLSNRAADPCQGTLPVSNAALRALCIATGAPAATIGAIPAPSAGQINNTTGGNPNLDVERAKTYTLGLVMTPPQIPRLSVTIDYFNIKITDAISTPTVGNIVDGCYSTTLNPTLTYNGFCALIGRNPLTGGLNGTGETRGAQLITSNQGVIETAGIDFGVNYRIDLADLGMSGDPGSLRFGVNGTWLDYYHFQASPVSINRNCTGYYSNDCGNPRAKFRSNARLTYSKGIADLSLMWTHMSKVKIEPVAPTPLPPFSTPQTGGPNPANVFDAFESVKAYDYFDLSALARVTESVTLSVLVENLFDKDPPLVAGVGINTPVMYDVLGRTFTFTAAVKF